MNVRLSSAVLWSLATTVGAQTGSLPGTSADPVDFNRDIRPILEAACLRCHGPVRPKSGLRLDQRESALRGGTEGVAIVPGRAAESPLILRVSRTVPGKEMPPTGKGEALTAAEVARLRAWIDQGARWGESPGDAPQIELSVRPVFRAFSVSGNERLFQEHSGRTTRAAGGVEQFSITQRLDADTRVTLSGHAFPAAEDYAVEFTLARRELGFVRGEFTQWRRFHDDGGGYYAPFATPGFRSGRDLFLDGGKAAFEFGLTLPDWPRMTLGYEYQFRDGTQSTLHWGGSTQGGVTSAIFPSSRAVDEQVHVLRFDLEHELGGARVENNFRAEWLDLATRKEQASSFGAAAVTPAAFVLVREEHRQFQGANTLRVEGAVTDWLFGSAGHLFSRWSANAGFRMATSTAGGLPAVGEQWFANRIVLERESHLFSASARLGPWAGLVGSGTVQSEWTRQSGLGDANLQMGDPGIPPLSPDPIALSTSSDQHTLTEHVTLRYTEWSRATLFAEGRRQQESRGIYENQAGGREPFLRRSEAHGGLREFRAGFHAHLAPGMSLSASYQQRKKFTDYEHPVHVTATHPYPGFLRRRSSDEEQVEARLTARVAGWWKLVAGYRLAATDYVTVTDAFPPTAPGGATFAANHDAHTWSLGQTLTPFRRWNFDTTLAYTASRVASAQNGVDFVVPWRGSLVSVLAGVTFAWDESLDFHVNHSFSRADYGRNTAPAVPPAGMNYDRHELHAGVTRRFSNRAAATVNYSFHRYREPTAGTFHDYTAHGIFAALSLAWPEKSPAIARR